MKCHYERYEYAPGDHRLCVVIDEGPAYLAVITENGAGVDIIRYETGEICYRPIDGAPFASEESAREYHG